MAESVIQASFAAGELSKNLFGRVDLDKYHTGAERVRNFFVDYRGGASTRVGTSFIMPNGDPANKTRLISFIVSTDQSYVLIFGNGTLRFISNGSPIIEDTFQVLSITSSNPAVVTTVPNTLAPNDTVTLTGLTGDFAQLNGTTFAALPSSATDLQLIDLFGVPLDTTLFAAGGDTGTLERYLELLVPWQSADLPLLKFTQSADVMTLCHPDYPAYNLTRTGASSFVLILNGVGPDVDAPTNLIGTASDGSGVLNYGYVVSAVKINGEESVPSASVTVTSVPLDPTGAPWATTPIDPANIALGWDTVTDADHYQIYKWGPLMDTNSDSTSFGLIGSSSDDQFTDNNIAPDFSRTPQQYKNPFATANPTCVTYFQQRRVFGGITAEQLDFSKPGQYTNFDVSAFTFDSDAISVFIVSRQVNTIKALVSTASGLIILTSGGAFQVSGGSPTAAITPSSITALPQASSGANDMPPLVVNYDILFVQNKGSIVRDLAYNFYLNTYYGFDRSALSNHLFFGYTLLEWAYAEEPFKLIWVVRNDGRLLSLTYVPEQEVYGWAHHDTQGQVESVCSVPEGNEDAVYLVVRRKLEGGTVRLIERMASRHFTRVEDTWCVDSGLATVLPRPDATLKTKVYGDNVAGTQVELIADSAVFTTDDVGSTVWLDVGGKLEVTTFISATRLYADILQSIGNVIPNKTPEDYYVLDEGTWEIGANVTEVSGLFHLADQAVWAVADGQAFEKTVSSSGKVSFDEPASKIVIGLGFQAQLQTLNLDVGDPTVQGKLKNIPAATIRVDQTRGIVGGASFEEMYPFKDLPSANYTPPIPLVSTDLRYIFGGDWNTEGQVCIEQNYPFPATILGIIPEVLFGDTQK